MLHRDSESDISSPKDQGSRQYESYTSGEIEQESKALKPNLTNQTIPNSVTSSPLRTLGSKTKVFATHKNSV